MFWRHQQHLQKGRYRICYYIIRIRYGIGILCFVSPQLESWRASRNETCLKLEGSVEAKVATVWWPNNAKSLNQGNFFKRKKPIRIWSMLLIRISEFLHVVAYDWGATNSNIFHRFKKLPESSLNVKNDRISKNNVDSTWLSEKFTVVLE